MSIWAPCRAVLRLLIFGNLGWLLGLRSVQRGPTVMSHHACCITYWKLIKMFPNTHYFNLPFAELPKQLPIITGVQTRYRHGDMIRGNCTSFNSKPGANLTWHINDKEVCILINVMHSSLLDHVSLTWWFIWRHFVLKAFFHLEETILILRLFPTIRV